MLRVIAITVLLAMPAMAGWQRYWANGDQPDSPPPHPLAYFQVHPCLRSDPKDRVDNCVPSDDPRTPFKARIYLHEIGKIGKFTIFDVDYHYQPPFDSDPGGDDILAAKSVIVQSGRDEFHEIYVIEKYWGGNLAAHISASEVLSAGDQLVVKTEFWDGGNLVPATEVYFAFDQNGPILLDFEPLYKSAASAIPAGKGGIWNLLGGFDMPGLTFTTGVNVEAMKTSCCQGMVKVRFRIDPSGRVVPINAVYEPDPDQ